MALGWFGQSSGYLWVCDTEAVPYLLSPQKRIKERLDPCPAEKGN
jgi:hypothetical protein